MKSLTLLLIFVIITTGVFSQRLLKNLKNSHAGGAFCLAVSNDGTKILTGGMDKRTYIWDAKSGDKLKTIGTHTDKVTGVALSSDNKLFATASTDKKVIVWETETGKPKGILKGQTTAITCIAFNPVNNMKAAGEEGSNIVIWDEANKLMATLEGHSKKVNSIEFSPDGRFLASVGDDNNLIIWNVESFQIENTIETGLKKVACVSYSSDGKFIACGGAGGAVGMWDAGTGNKLTDFEGLNGDVLTVDFTPDVQYVAAAGMDNQIVIWELELSQISRNIKAHSKGINAIQFNDKGTILASVGNDGAISIWDIDDLEIGKKKATEDSETPELVCSNLRLIEKDENGILSNEDQAKLAFTITNKGKGIAYDVAALIELDKPIDGLIIDPEVYVGNLTSGKSQKIEIPITIYPEVATVFGAFKLSLTEANGNVPEPQDIEFQTKGSSNVFIMVADYKYSSATGKAETGSPITMKLMLKNATNAVAKDIKIKYLFPENVVAVDKRMETVPEFQPNELKEVSVQFYADKGFTEKEVKIGVEIEGAAHNNLKDIVLAVTMNEDLPVNTEAYIANMEVEEGVTFRGGGDPLKGLNTASALREMQFGNYYALIIGIDKYKGEWTPLQNAVRDAKAVEGVLRDKYKFDYFKVMFDEKATREAIIQEMEWLVANVKSNDNVFIYYSGHGDYKQQLNKGYWVPADATATGSTSKYISNSDIQTFLGGISSKHTLLISDACFSGDIFRGNTVSVPFENSEKYYQKVNNLDSRQAISSGGIEPVMDGGRDGHSVFAYYLLKTLGNNTYKYFDASQLFEKIRVPVTNNSEQSPAFSPVKNTGDEGGQFIFIKR